MITHKALSLWAIGLLLSLTLVVAPLESALSADPGPTGSLEQGRKEYAARKWDAAVASFTNVITADPGCKEAYFLRGDALRQSGKIFEGMKDLRRVLEIDPEDAEAWRSLGKAFRSLKNDEDESACYSKALAYTKDDATRRILAGWKAKIDARLKASPSDKRHEEVRTLFNKAVVQQLNHDKDAAVKTCTEALKRFPGDKAFQRLAGELYEQTGKPTEALQHYEQALLLDPEPTTTRYRMVSILRTLGEKQRALDELERVLKEDPANFQCRLDLGTVFNELGKPDAAAEEFRKALELTDDQDRRSEILALIATLDKAASPSSPQSPEAVPSKEGMVEEPIAVPAAVPAPQEPTESVEEPVVAPPSEGAVAASPAEEPVPATPPEEAVAASPAEVPVSAPQRPAVVAPPPPSPAVTAAAPPGMAAATPTEGVIAVFPEKPKASPSVSAPTETVAQPLKFEKPPAQPVAPRRGSAQPKRTAAAPAPKASPASVHQDPAAPKPEPTSSGTAVGGQSVAFAAIPAAPQPKAPEAIKVKTIQVGGRQDTSGIAGMGSIACPNTLDLGFDDTGVIAEMLVDEGDVIQKGQVLAKLDSALLEGEKVAVEAKIRAAEVEVEFSKNEYERRQALFKKEAVSEAELKKAQMTWQKAEAMLGLNEAELKVLDIKLKKRLLVAPISGIVARRIMNVGASVMPGSNKVIRLVQCTGAFAEIELGEKLYGLVQRAKRVDVQVDALEGKVFRGRLSAVGPEIDKKHRTFTARIHIDDPNMLLRPGMFVRAQIQTPEQAEALWMPKKAALLADARQNAVYVVKDGVALKKYVELGEVADQRVQVLKGLRAGDSVVVEGQDRISDLAEVSAEMIKEK